MAIAFFGFWDYIWLMKKSNKFVAYINGACALIWLVKVILDVTLLKGTSDYFTLILVLDIACTFIWFINFFVWRGKSKKEDE